MSRMKFGRYDIAVFLTFVAFAFCSMAVPMSLVQLATDMDFPLGEGGMGLGGLLQMGRAVPMVLAMVLCGFAGGIWGKRRSLGIAVLLMGTGIMLCAVSPGYGVLLFALAISGLGEGVVEGLVTPFVQDLHPEQPGRYLNVSHSFWSVGVLVLVLGMGALLALGISWRVAVFMTGAVSIMPAAFFLLPGKSAPAAGTEEKKTHWLDIVRMTRQIVGIPRFWLFFATMFFVGGGEFCLTFWCASFIQIEFGGSELVAGAGTACLAGGMFAGRLVSGLAVQQRNLKKLILVFAIAAAAVTMFFPWVYSKWTLFVLLFLAGIAFGPFWPSIQSDGTRRVRGDHTMMMILLSCAGIPGSAFFSMILGVTGDALGLRMSFLVVPACFFVVFILMYLDYLVERREGCLSIRAVAEGKAASGRLC